MAERASFTCAFEKRKLAQGWKLRFSCCKYIQFREFIREIKLILTAKLKTVCRYHQLKQHRTA